MRKNCPICNSEPALSRPAKVATFLQQHADVSESETKALYCKYCDFVWHELGLTDEQSQKLYKDYRGAKYNQTRIEIEPEYKFIADDFSNLHSAHYRERSGELDSLFRNKKKRIKRTLDLGGDALFTKWTFPAAVNDFSDLSHGEVLTDNSRGYDVVFCFHLLEHVNDPISIMNEAWKHVGKDGILVTAVPREFDPPLNRHFEITSNYESAIFNMHEHMNFYSERSIENLANFAKVPLVTSRLLSWNGLLSFFSNDASWLDFESLQQYEFKRLQNMINDQFQELRELNSNKRTKKWMKR